MRPMQILSCAAAPLTANASAARAASAVDTRYIIPPLSKDAFRRLPHSSTNPLVRSNVSSSDRWRRVSDLLTPMPHGSHRKSGLPDFRKQSLSTRLDPPPPV